MKKINSNLSSSSLNDEKQNNTEISKNEDDNNENKVPPVSFIKLYKYSTWKEKIFVIIGILGAVVTGLTSPANILIFGDLTDSLIGHAMVNGTTDELLKDIQKFAINNSILGVIMLIFSYLSIMLFNYAALGQIHRIRGIFFRSAINQDVSWYDLNKSGEFASRMNEDLTKLEDGIGEKVVMFIHFIVSFIGLIILAFVKGWELALICLSSLPVTFISLGVVAHITAKLAKKEMDAYARAGSIAEEVISAIRTIVAFGGQDKEVERYKENLQDARKINVRKGFFSGFGFGLLWFFIYASYGLAFWYGVVLVIKQRPWNVEDQVYTPGVMITVFFAVMMGSMSIGMASPYIEAFATAKAAGAKVYQLIGQIPVINTLIQDGKSPQKIFEKIVFKNVCFQYPSRPDVKILEDFNLTINRGETVALVGSSGCGKSTCIQLIQRFYDPITGEIYLDDENIKNLNVNWLREKIGVVGQEPILFSTTIYENIRYGKENATKEEIENAAKTANAHLFIKKLPKGYDTLVGERGAQLSGGQKQRIAIARALVRNPDILLLDEATSALDTVSEAKVQSALEKASKGRTTIIIAHRLSTIRNADKIFVLDKGKIIETGAHKELMELGGHYHSLVTTQVGTEIIVQSPTTNGTFFNHIDDDDDNVHIEATKEDSVEHDKTAIQNDVSFLRIVKLNATEWPYILIGSLSSVVMGFSMPLFAVLFGDILGVLSSLDNDHVRSETNIYCLYFVVAGIVIGFATFFQIYTFGIAGEILTERLRGQAFAAMLRQEIAWFDDKSNGTGTLCARLSADAAAVQGATGQRIGSVLQSVATLFLSIGLSMYYNWKLGLVTLAFTPFIMIAIYFERKIMTSENFGKSKAMEDSTKLAVEVVSNIRTVKSLGKENMFYEKYVMLLTPSVNKAKRNTHYRGFVYGIGRSIMFFAYAVCMFYGGYLISNEGLHYENVFKVSQGLIMGTVAVANALAFAPNFQKGVDAAAKILDLLQRSPKITDTYSSSRDEKLSLASIEGNVSYKSVKFSYPTRSDIQVLKGLTLNVSKGQTVALVGPSGCGKSTCIQLLERYYDVDDGSITLDDRDIRHRKLSNLRKQIGIVSQEPTLFDRTIAENIAYGDNSRQIEMQNIINAAKNANIHNFIISLPSGYDTKLGEKGTQLSGGQKQRIAIARALIRNPKILLLDEATSALDAESEKVVQNALDEARKGRTCITIAHRLSTIIDSDIIFVLNSGIVAEFGTHKELIDKKGIYYNLYRLQNGK